MVGRGERFKIIFQTCDAYFELPCYYKAGADIVIGKNIGRQSINFVVANTRGAGRAYGKEYGFDFDCWFMRFVWAYSPREVSHGLKVYFCAGGKYFNNETPAPPKAWGWWLRNELSSTVTKMHATWLDFVRWARAHPRRGEQVVKIAFMRSLGRRGYHNDWARERSYGEPNPDYILFRLVFPHFDRCTSTRLCTGTPFGPVDIIPWDTPLSYLRTYGLVVYLGSEGFCMDEEQYLNLREYVRQGGVLVLPLGQMREEKGKFFRGGDFADFLGVRAKGWKKVYFLKPEQERLIALVK